MLRGPDQLALRAGFGPRAASWTTLTYAIPIRPNCYLAPSQLNLLYYYYYYIINLLR